MKLNYCWHWLAARRAAQLAERLRPHLTSTGRALDVGSGTGHNAVALRSRCGIEVAEVDVVDMHVVGEGPTLFDGTSLPFADGQFATTLLVFVLQYPVDPLRLLMEARRVASERVLVIQSTYRSRLGLAMLKLREFWWGRFGFRLARMTRFVGRVACPLQPRRYWTRKSLVAAGRAAGLTLREVHSESRGRGSSQAAWLSRDLFVWEVTTTS